MNYKKTILKNGVRVISVPMPSLASATLTIWVKTGSRNEVEKERGISHFLEHMVFKGSKKRPSAAKISSAVDAIGGEFNAATSKDWTNYYIKARKDKLDMAFDVLADMVLNPLLKEEEIEREKGVIVEEMGMYEDTPIYRIGDVFEELIFEGNSLGWDTIGTERTVRGLNRNDFLRYKGIQYDSRDILVTVAGGVKEKEVLDLVGKYFGHLETKKLKNLRTEEFKSKQAKPQVKLHPKKKEQAHFILGFLGHGRPYPQRFSEAVLSAILGGGMSSRLFLEVRERRGLAYAVKTNVDRYQETGYLGTYAGVDPKKIEEAIKVTLEEYYKVASGAKPVSREELKKAKEYLKGHLALALEDTKNVNGFFAEQELFIDKVLTPEEVFKKVDEVTTESVITEAKKLFVPHKLNLAIIGPYEDPDRFQRLLK